ncbi:thrombospondin type 3 repeat-containing protein [Ferrimonas sediminum]|uniref:thrombospondin type 3 repeat-containing protein n=1 Tax=Ferrimonas sediminum TaxID=718193 RepID=UPI00115FAAA8|nr:thrombospondin type 3 repeat-containing protein [Ferrimonas sediminum]
MSADQIIEENLIINGAQCVGYDCVNGEVFSGELLRLKENNLRIRFFDGEPLDAEDQGWEVTANSQYNGGESFLGFVSRNDDVEEVQFSDGTYRFYYDCSTVPGTYTGIPVTVPAGEPILDWRTCEPLLNVMHKPALRLGPASDTDNSVTLGYHSEFSVGAVSVGKAELLRQIKHVAAGLAETDLLIRKQMLSPARVLETRLDALEAEVAELERLVTAAENSDFDGDGLNDYLDSDDDNDLMPDSWEKQYALNQFDPSDAAGDADSDGASNLMEYQQGLDPTNPDTDGDQVSDGEDVFPLDPEESVDSDGDGIGNNADLDDDNDGMPDLWELQYGLNPLSGADAHIDSDGDGMTNLEEFNNGQSDPTRDTVAPEIALDGELWFDATGLYTEIEAGTVTAHDFKDGDLPVSRIQGQERLAPGRHLFKYRATDAAGNTAVVEQAINVRPLIDFAQDQTMSEGSAVAVRVFLNGDAPIYPVIVPYSVGGSAVFGEDHDLEDGVVVIEAERQGVILFNTLTDQVPELDEVITLTLTDPDEALNLGTKLEHRATIREGNIPPEIRLSVSQDGEARSWIALDGGPVTVSVEVSDANPGDSHRFDWTLPAELAPAPQESDGFSFFADQLTVGAYRLAVTVTDSGAPALADSASLDLVVKAALPTLGAQVDSDGDGIPDAVESFKDSDADGVPDYLDSAEHGTNVINQRAIEANLNLLESDPGTRLTLGSLSRLTEHVGVQLTEEDMAEGSAAIGQDSLVNVGGVFDFEVHGLPEPGQSVQVVIPQRQPIPDYPTYRKFLPGFGWSGFVENATNGLASAQGLPGYCPPPGDDSYRQGLTPGDWCVRLTIEDGGPNDHDGTANGSVEDPGGVAQMQSIDTDITVSGSGGTLNWFIALFALAALCRRNLGHQVKRRG